jgi:hypothetical protein
VAKKRHYRPRRPKEKPAPPSDKDLNIEEFMKAMGIPVIPPI